MLMASVSYSIPKPGLKGGSVFIRSKRFYFYGGQRLLYMKRRYLLNNGFPGDSRCFLLSF